MTRKIVLIATSFHKEQMEIMVAAARKTIREVGLKLLREVWVPGSYECPLALSRELDNSDVDGAVVLGIIEKGETKHGLVMAMVVHSAIVDLELQTGKPISKGILGPEIMPSQIPPRLEPYARGAVLALRHMLEGAK